MRTSPEYQKLAADYAAQQKQLQAFMGKGSSDRGTPDVPHGYVWLFRRK
jgi:hypothetical protein